MAPSQDTRRLLRMLTLLVSVRKPLTSKELRAKLPRSLRTHVRSVQRDLKLLAKMAPLVVDRSAKPYRWSVKPKSTCPCCSQSLPS